MSRDLRDRGERRRMPSRDERRRDEVRRVVLHELDRALEKKEPRASRNRQQADFKERDR